MKVIDTGLDGLHIQPNVFKDERGYFLEAFHEKKYAEFGIVDKFVQDNRSRSVRNVLRGLHFQICKPQGKLVSVTAGEVFDVAVDLRPMSRTFGKHYSVILSSDTHVTNFIFLPVLHMDFVYFQKQLIFSINVPASMIPMMRVGSSGMI